MIDNNEVEVVRHIIEKDVWDILGVFVPIVLSVIAIAISLWSGYFMYKVKRVDANLIWDDLSRDFYLVVRNACERTLVIDSISLVAYDKTKKEELEIGTRNNAWISNIVNGGPLKKGEMMVISPVYGTIYDVFGYKGHAFDVDDENKSLMVYIHVTDIDGKTWKFKTLFSLWKLDQLVEQAMNKPAD